MSTNNEVFISYAWGGSMENKEWIRQSIVPYLHSYGLSVFWDRDAIQFGEVADYVINQALSARPIRIFCICDMDYTISAAKNGSGLFRELKMLSNIAHMDGVLIIPVLIDERAKQALPPVLENRIYLDLTELHALDIPIGPVLASVALGATQAEVLEEIEIQLKSRRLMNKADELFRKLPFNISGDARTHKVLINNERLLLPPDWMSQRVEWSERLLDRTESFNPQKGVWHWDHRSSSTGMWMLGIAVCSAIFPNRVQPREISAIEHCGKILAQREFAFIKNTEAFNVTGSQLMRTIVMESGGHQALDILLG